jgi:hypothetical protein
MRLQSNRSFPVVVLRAFGYTPFAARSFAVAKQQKKRFSERLQSVQTIWLARSEGTEGHELGALRIDGAGSSFGAQPPEGHDGQKTKTQGGPLVGRVRLVPLLRATVCASAL